jgi:hypothetical protein
MAGTADSGMSPVHFASGRDVAHTRPTAGVACPDAPFRVYSRPGPATPLPGAFFPTRPTPVGESIVWRSLAQGELGQRPFFVRPAAVRLARTYLGGGKPALSEKAVPESPPAGFGTPVAFPTLAPPKEWSTVTVV